MGLLALFCQYPIDVALEWLWRVRAAVAFSARVGCQWPERTLGLIFIRRLPLFFFFFFLLADELLGIFLNMRIVVKLTEVFSLGIRDGVERAHRR